MWLKSPEDVKDIQIQKLQWNTYEFFYPKKKKKSSTKPKRKIIVTTSYLSKPDGQVGIIVLW